MTAKQILRVVTLDLEGTLIDLERHHFKAFEEACLDFGIALSAREITEMPGAIGGGDAYIAFQLAIRAGFSADEILARKQKIFDELVRAEPCKARPGALEAIEWFTCEGVPLAIASITARARAEALLVASGIAGFVPRERWVLDGDVGNRKPAPDAYAETARRLGVPPTAQLVFEDSAVGVRAAREAGSTVIGMPVLPLRLAQMELLEEGAVRLFHSWEEINLPILWRNLSPGAAR